VYFKKNGYEIQTCEIEIVKGAVSKDHVHFLVSAPPNLEPSEIMRRIKGRSANKLFEAFPELKKILGRTFLSKRVFFCYSRDGNKRDDREIY